MLEVVVVDSLFLPVCRCGFVVPEYSKGFFVPSAGSVEIALGELTIRFRGKKFVTEVLDMER
jgi:hypothetical protein